nr:SusD/RagB family nutrient-binding outer membrane lipoprotein [Sphingobacterium sp. E70]
MGVSQEDINSYISKLPAANKEHVLSQKYLALFNQSIEAWSEIRRTGYPLFLIKKEMSPGAELSMANPSPIPLIPKLAMPYQVVWCIH